MALHINVIISAIENLDEESFKDLWKIAHPRKADKANEKWEEFNNLTTYKEKEFWFVSHKDFLHYVEAYCVGYKKSMN